MAARHGIPRAQQVLVSVLLGILIVVIVGVGVRMLYPPPVQNDAQLQRLNDEQRALDSSRRLVGKLSGKHEAYFKNLSTEIAAKKEALQSGREAWHRNSTIALVALGALLMGLSLIRVDRRWAVKDGLFLGGFFTICYAVVWSFAESSAVVSFAVLGVALAVVLVIGYLRLVQSRKLNVVRSTRVEPTPPAA
ncbi:MAG: hypothetical protein P4L93_08360 [Coriobacteriia bacterium]|nr:hypothetical protein [Coriobacteriia bacterium]